MGQVGTHGPGFRRDERRHLAKPGLNARGPGGGIHATGSLRPAAAALGAPTGKRATVTPGREWPAFEIPGRPRPLAFTPDLTMRPLQRASAGLTCSPSATPSMKAKF